MTPSSWARTIMPTAVPDNDAATFVGGALFLDFPNFNFSVGGTLIHVQNSKPTSERTSATPFIGAITARRSTLAPAARTSLTEMAATTSSSPATVSTR